MKNMKLRLIGLIKERMWNKLVRRLLQKEGVLYAFLWTYSELNNQKSLNIILMDLWMCIKQCLY